MLKKLLSISTIIAVVAASASGIYWLSISLLAITAFFVLLGTNWQAPFRKRVFLLRTIILVFMAVALAIGVRLFVFGVYNVGSNSMRDTLVPGDYVWVNKLSYGPLVPVTIYDIPWIGVGYWLIKGRPDDLNVKDKNPVRLKGSGLPSNNDVVVFNKPGTGEVFIKRCVAGPGDTLEIREGVILVNGIRLADPSGVRTGGTAVADWRVFPGIDSLGWDIANWGPYILPHRGMVISRDEKRWLLYERLIARNEGIMSESVMDSQFTFSDIYTFNDDYYFMLGDNRHASHDSRFFGPVPDYAIIGKATFIIGSIREGHGSGRRFLRGINR